jgi:aldehyde:ferredoxin oxidoreductase
MTGGYAGKILYINLSQKKIRNEQIDTGFAKRFLGGAGFGAKMLYDNTPQGISPFDPRNLLIFATGPFTGTLSPQGCKFSVVTKGPVIMGYCEAEGGGYFGPEMKFAGYDAVVISGKSKEPVYLDINDDNVVTTNAEELWGKGVYETDRLIKEEIGDRSVKIAAIGPAGENLVRYSCITNDFSRQAGRGGVGAVMGSKRLKAIAIRGTKDIKVANPEDFKKMVWKGMKKTLWKSLTDYGTLSGLSTYNEWGVLPTRNFQTSYFEKNEKLDALYVKKKLYQKNRACFGCPIACSHIRMIKKGRYSGTIVEGPEHETATMLGPACGIDSIEAITYANLLCDDLGLDTISAGNVVGFAMECYERGIITKKDTDGLELTFGNYDAQIELLKKIAMKDGLGDILADGVMRAAEKFKGAKKFAMHVKGLELPAYDPRKAIGQGLAFAIADVGGTHGRAWTIGLEIEKMTPQSPEGKADVVKKSTRERMLPDIMGYCRFVLLGYAYYAKLLSALTGWTVTADSLVEIVDRVYTLTRAFNAREGFRRKDDYLPDRMLTEPVPNGPAKGSIVQPQHFKRMIDEYYALWGWDPMTGVPKRETLLKSGLEDVAADLEKRGILPRRNRN